MAGSSTSFMSRAKVQVLVGAIVVQMILGTVYGYSIFWEPLNAEVFPAIVTQAQTAGLLADGVTQEQLADSAQYTVVADQDAADKQEAVQSSYLKYAFSLCILSFAFAMVIAGRIQDIKGPRFPAIVGAVMMGVGFLLAGLMEISMIFYLAHAAFVGGVAVVLLMISHAILGKVDEEEVPLARYVPMGIMAAVIVGGVVIGNRFVGQLEAWDKLFMLWGTVGFLAGAGTGFAYVSPIAALVKWFPENKGLVSGIAVAGFGFGAYLFKGKTQLGALGYIEQHGIADFFVIHGIVCLIGVSLGALVLRNPPGFIKATSRKSQADDATQRGWQDTLKRPAFHLLWLMFFSGALAGLMVISIVKDFVDGQLEQAAVGAAAVGWLAIFNAIGRVAWGLISDKIGRTTSFIAMFILQAVTMIVLGYLNTEVALIVGASLVGFNYGGIFALFPSATADLFGAKNLGANYGWVFTSYGIAGVVVREKVSGTVFFKVTRDCSFCHHTASLS